MPEKENRYGAAAILLFHKMKEKVIAQDQIKKEFSKIADSDKGCPRSTFYYLVAKGYLKGFDGFELTAKQLASNNCKCVDLAIKYLSENKIIKISPEKLWYSFELKSTSSRNKGGLVRHNNQMDVVLDLFRENALNIK